MICIGIDPGISGAVAVIDPNNQLVLVFDTPTNQIKKAGKTKSGKERFANEYSESEMARLFTGELIIVKAISENNIHVFIEKVHTMPGEGAVGAFSFGKGYGVWLGILAALKIPYTLITPQAWKKDMMQGIKDKDAARGRAQQLFPQLSAELRFKNNIGRADALLIAEFGKRSLQSNNIVIQNPTSNSTYEPSTRQIPPEMQVKIKFKKESSGGTQGY